MDTMMETDNPIERIVVQFGDSQALARQIGRGKSTVFEWVAKGRVPVQNIGNVIMAGRRMNPPIDLEPNDFFPRRYRKQKRMLRS